MYSVYISKEVNIKNRKENYSVSFTAERNSFGEREIDIGIRLFTHRTHVILSLPQSEH